MLKTIYHITDGPKEMYVIDAQSAVANFPEEWSASPWPEGVEDLSKLGVKKLQQLAAAEGVEFETDNNKATLIEKITAARAAKG